MIAVVSWRRVGRDAVCVALAGVVVAVVAAGAVWVLGAGEAVRGWYGLTPEDPARVGVGDLWVHNVRALVPVFAAAAAVVWWPRARVAIDVGLGVMLGVNVVAVSVALAAYGSRLWALGPGHYPLELLAIAIAAAAYLDARRAARLRPGLVVACAIAACLVLVLAAVLESAGAA